MAFSFLRSDRALRSVVSIVGLALALALPARAAEGSPKGWLGVVLGSSAPQADDSGETVLRGVPIMGVVEGGPAAKAGLRAQDRIVAVEAKVVSSTSELSAVIGGMAPGRWISLTVERGDDELDFGARLTEHPTRGKDLRIRMAWIGLEAIELPESLREHFGSPPEAGVMISAVVDAGPADVAGLEIGDVVYEVGGEAVRAVSDLRRIVTQGGVGNTLELVLTRNGAEITLEAMLAAMPEKKPEPKKSS